MKNRVLSVAAVAVGLVLSGCETPEGNPNRAGTGALIGAGTGATIGALAHNGEGALIGGALGALAGGLIGHSMDQEAAARLRAQAPQTYTRIEQGQPLGVADVKAMSRAGVGDEVIISQIRNTHTVYHLSAADIIDLHDSGVSQKVIDFMINTPSTVGPSAAVAAPPQAQTVYVAQAPPPPLVETVVVAPGPGYFWVGGEWVWSGRWTWVSGRWCLPPRGYTVWVSGHWTRGPHGWHHAPGHWR